MDLISQDIRSHGTHLTAPRRKDFLIFGSPFIGLEEKEEVLKCLESGWLGTGPKVAQFEKDFATYKRASYAVALSSCTAALHVSLLAAGIKPGDEVITTALTFCATVNAIIHAGATPVLADCDPITMNIDPEDVKAKITPKTRAILPVHFGGRPCSMADLLSIATNHNLKMVEDCAHAIEAEWEGQPAGTFGDFGCFSFYVTKNITTGEGGMVLAKRREDSEKIKVLGLHGMSKDAWKRFSDDGYKHYDVVDCGFKYNMMDLQASIGIHQLRNVEQGWHRRRQIWDCYSDAFCQTGLGLPAKPAENTRHSFHLYTVLIDEKFLGISRDQFITALTCENIGVGVHYRAIPEHTFYKNEYDWNIDRYPNAKRIGRQTVSLPLSPKLTDKDVQDVISAVLRVLSRGL